MTAGLDRTQIRRRFGRAARSYAEHAVLQAEVGTRLREWLDLLPEFTPQRLLDVGSGPGDGARALSARWPDAAVVALDVALPMLREVPAVIARVNADAEALPFADAAFDLVHSNLCLQWCNDPGLAIAEFRRVLAPGGVLLFSTFGPDTLKELRTAFAKVDATPHVSRFIDMHHVGDALLATGFRDPVLEREDFVLTYADLPALMRDLRAIGATNADTARTRTLSPRARFAAAAEAYERFRSDGLLPATYEVVYAAARAPDEGQPMRRGGVEIATFDIEHLRRSRRGQVNP